MISQVKSILLIRHGKSLMNQRQTAFAEAHPQINYEFEYEKALADPKFRRQVVYTTSLIDCGLSEKGKKQCVAARDLLKDEPIDIILVSPLVRAIQTKNLIFANRPIKTIVCPELTEGFRQSCSMGRQIEKTEVEFAECDFSRMRKVDAHWYIQNLSGYALFLKWKEHHPTSTFSEEQEVIVQMMQSQQLYEADEDLRLRALRIKELFQFYGKQYPRIAVISHYYTIQTLLTKGLTSKEDLLKYNNIRNALPYRISLADL